MPAAEDFERSASRRTSSATTAKPRPPSPARAASIAAFSASRLVWSAISLIRARMVPISLTFSASASVRSPEARCRPRPARGCRGSRRLGGDAVDGLGDRGRRAGQLLGGGRGLGDRGGLLGGGGRQPLDDRRELVGVAPYVDPGRVEGPGDVAQDEADEQSREHDRAQCDQDRHQYGRACAGGGPLGDGDHRQAATNTPTSRARYPFTTSALQLPARTDSYLVLSGSGGAG